MSQFSGKQAKGAMTRRRELKREQAEARQAARVERGPEAQLTILMGRVEFGGAYREATRLSHPQSV